MRRSGRRRSASGCSCRRASPCSCAAGIASLPRGQRQAATALGLTTVQGYRYVLLPMAFRIILPPLTSEFLNTIKNTSVAITIGLIELTGQARAMQEFSFQVFEAFTAATRAVSPDQRRRRHRACASSSAAWRSPATSRGNSAMFGNFDFDVIRRSLPYLFLDGMTFTLMLTALVRAGRPGLRHADRADAAVRLQAARAASPGSMSTSCARCRWCW